MERDPRRVIRFSIRELLSLAYRLREKIKDKFFWTHQEMEEAIGYLIYFRNHIKKENSKIYETIFGETGALLNPYTLISQLLNIILILSVKIFLLNTHFISYLIGEK
jgi:hemerythrin-like domain-containing protein